MSACQFDIIHLSAIRQGRNRRSKRSQPAARGEIVGRGRDRPGAGERRPRAASGRMRRGAGQRRSVNARRRGPGLERKRGSRLPPGAGGARQPGRLSTVAAAFAQHHSNTRQAGQLYTAWRSGSAAIRKRLLDDPALFFKTQRPAEPKATVAPAVELSRPRDPHP